MKKTNAYLNTIKILEYYRNLNNEFELLKGLLCFTHPLGWKESQKYYKLIDTVLIAKRMDEINKESWNQVKNVFKPNNLDNL